jgi:hypothetical protein
MNNKIRSCQTLGPELTNNFLVVQQVSVDSLEVNNQLLVSIETESQLNLDVFVESCLINLVGVLVQGGNLTKQKCTLLLPLSVTLTTFSKSVSSPISSSSSSATLT